MKPKKITDLEILIEGSETTAGIAFRQKELTGPTKILLINFGSLHPTSTLLVGMNINFSPVSRNIMHEIRLLHQLKHREETGMFIAEGERVVGELLRSELQVKMVVCLEDFAIRHSEMLNDLNVYVAADRDLQRISLLKTPNKVLAVAKKPAPVSVSFRNSEGVYLFLDGIRDPGNMGTLIRTAEWFGVNAVFCSSDCVEVWNPKVVQGTMGSIFRVPVSTNDLVHLADQAGQDGVNDIMGASLSGSPLEMPGGGAEGPKILVIGSEAAGISKELEGKLSRLVRISSSPSSQAESLNAAVAAGILLHILGTQKK